jgi:hypothetical protein
LFAVGRPTVEAFFVCCRVVVEVFVEETLESTVEIHTEGEVAHQWGEEE